MNALCTLCGWLWDFILKHTRRIHASDDLHMMCCLVLDLNTCFLGDTIILNYSHSWIERWEIMSRETSCAYFVSRMSLLVVLCTNTAPRDTSSSYTTKHCYDLTSYTLVARTFTLNAEEPKKDIGKCIFPRPFSLDELHHFLLHLFYFEICSQRNHSRISFDNFVLFINIFVSESFACAWVMSRQLL